MYPHKKTVGVEETNFPLDSGDIIHDKNVIFSVEKSF